MRFEKEINIYGDEAVLKRFQANETSIAIVQGNISAIISESELVELQNSSATMYSKLASAVMDIDSLTLNFSDLTTKYNTVSGQYSSLDSKVTQYKASVDGLSADITQVSQNLSKNYSTTSQMNTAINAKANEITSSVSATYATKNQLNNYSTTSQMNSAIAQKANEITSSVSNTYATISALNTANGKISALESWRSEASLKITDSAIISTVTQSSTYETSVNSLIEQKADSIRMKATTISWTSTYSSMTAAGALTCTSGKIGGWTIGSSALYNGMTSYGDTSHNGIWLGISRIAAGKGRFKVNSNGDVYCNNISSDAIDCTNFYSSGSVTFYVDNPADEGLYTNGKITCQTGFYCGDDIYAEGTIATPSWSSASDRRLKTDIRKLPEDAAGCLLRNLNPVSYHMRSNRETKRIGFIAQDVQAVLRKHHLDRSLFVQHIRNPETDETYLGLNYIDMIGVLWKGFQMLDKELEKLKAVCS